MKKHLCVLLLIFLSLSACTKKAPPEKVRLAINPWPGYEYLYLAKQKGFFEKHGLNVDLLELSSLADVSRIYEQGRADAMASTIIESVQVAGNLKDLTHIILVPDYSNGSDVIIAHKSIKNIQGLKGKKVGVELGFLGTFIMSQALTKEGMSLSDVNLINVEQLSVAENMKTGIVDAVTTYPPFSLETLKNSDTHIIFSTRDIPGDVIDVISMRAGTVKDINLWQQKFFNVWQEALDYTAQNPDEAYQIMGERENISGSDFKEAMKGLKIIPKEKQIETLKSARLKNNIEKACRVLVEANTLNMNCTEIHDYLQAQFN